MGCIQGCGESQEDLFMKHAKRSRSNDDAETVEAPAKAVAARPAKPQPEEQPNVAVAKPQPQAATATVESAPKGPEVDHTPPPASLAEELGIQPISERKPDAELSVAERRRRSVANMTKIYEALDAYRYQHRGYLPRAFSLSAGGLPTLSWRVEILPFLGYQKLYEKFDFSRGWNVSPNKELLEFIPDEYASVERFDTKTNYLVPSGGGHLFEVGSQSDPTRIDDGFDNTLILIEVNDSQAVNWTEPKDFNPPDVNAYEKYLGKLREDGTFAMWANGLPVLLASGLEPMQIRKALTHSGEEALRAVDIHRAIAIEEVEGDPETDLDESMDLPETSEVAGTPTQAPQLARPEIQEAEYQREPVPVAIEIATAQEKLRMLFRDRIAEAKSKGDKSKLAAEFLATGIEMDADAAGAYVLQEAALRTACEIGDDKILIEAIDQRVARFDVDSYRENLNWIRDFGQSTASRDESGLKSTTLLQRAIPVIFAGIHEDEYMEASAVARIANRYTSNSRDDVIPRLFTRLRTQLGIAKREYDKSVDYLQQYRKNPENRRAGAAFGNYLCFIKGDWEKGMDLIAQGEGNDLVEVVLLDRQGAGSAHEQVTLGDAWWELSRRGSGAYRQGAQDRAVAWYTQALERLPDSLDRIHVENRLQEAEATIGHSPIALCLQLAEELGVDLNQSLTSLAVDGNRSLRRDDDDD
ncbi:DUF1559 family PulG-like putative transporter [Stieleria maiorica]|nr:DUF1559 domain-containing protein [Stieleria maiorica]